MNSAWWLNTAWMWKCTPESWAFARATGRVAQTQAEVLARILRRNRQTEFGRRHGFEKLRTPADFQRAVPLSDGDDYAAAIDSIAAGKQGVRTRDRVELLEPTSGTTGGEKLIPYTAGLRRQFQRAVAAWMHDLLSGRPALRGGRAYWSISPALATDRRTAAGIPIGFDDDAAYLGSLERALLQRLLVVPASVARLTDVETFRYATLLHLVAAKDLTLISIWNPTFLTSLLEWLTPWQDRLCFDLRRGTLSPPDVQRAAELESIFRSRLSVPEKPRAIWPRLALVSCWTDAAAGLALPGLRELLPDVEIQPKGLLATEGCVSFPLLGRAAPVLAIRSHFFEFQDDGGEFRLAHELQSGGRYQVALTTAGGLYRYPLHDEIEVAGFENDCPLLRFLGKSNRVSDLVGEKLSEPHVRAVLDRVLARHRLAPRFALLTPVVGQPARYRLYFQVSSREMDPSNLTTDVEAGLCENPHYGYALQMGQLAPLELELLPADGEPAWQIYERCCLARGQRLGNIKPTALDSWTGWPAEFERHAHPL